LDAGYAVFVDSLTGQGVSLFDVLKETENLRARTIEYEQNGTPALAKKGVAPPPDASIFAQLGGLNEMKG
jgi:hypothetical protein